jgi:peptidyl-prolyl cis-trans isomerase D
MQQVSRQIGKVPTSEEALAMGIPSMVLSRLASEAAVNAVAIDMGLGVSDDRLATMVNADPSFSSTLGGFDAANFKRVLQQMGYTEKEYFELQAKAARRQQLASGLFAGSPVSATAYDLINRFSSDTRTVDYFVLNGESVAGVPLPTEDDLVAYLKEHQTEFRTKETRTVDLLALSPDVLASTKTISEDEISAEYERTKDSLVKIEKRTIKQIALTTPEQQKLFEDGKAAGKGIGELLATSGLAFTELGTLAKTEITDQSLADTAFGLAVDGYEIIEGIGGKRVITVSAITPGGQVTLAEARDGIAKRLAMTAARAEFNDVLDQIEELRAAFKPLAEIASRFNLTPMSVPVTADGAELSPVAAIPEADRGRVASAIFRADQGALDPTIVLGSNLSVWFDLKSVDVARDQTLDEVRDAVDTAWTAEKTDAALQAEVEKALGELKAGKAFADVAAELNQFPQLSQPLKRSGYGTPVINDVVASEIFNGGPDHVGTAINGDGDHVVFHVVEVTPATGAAPDAAKKYVEDGTRDTLYADFVSGITTEAGTSINQQVLSSLLAIDTTGQ